MNERMVNTQGVEGPHPQPYVSAVLAIPAAPRDLYSGVVLTGGAMRSTLATIRTM